MNKPQLLLILALLATSGPRLQAAEQVHVRADLVAVVNDRVILGSDFLGRMSPTAESLRRQYPNNPTLFQQKWQEQVQRVLEDLINDELILAEALAAGRQLPEDHLDQYIKSFIQTNYGGNSDWFVKALAAQGRTVDEFRERHGQSDLVAAAKREKTENLPSPTPEQIEQYYHAHEQDFSAKESVKLGMIMINQDPTNGPAAVEALRKEAAAIHARLVAGADFAAEAKLHSQGRSAQQGGDWGWIERSILRKELDVVAFSLKPGGLSDVIETKDACYIMRVADHRPGALKPLADVREDIGKILQTQARSAVIKQWHGRLRAKAFLRYFGGLAADSLSWESRVVGIEIKHIGVSTLSDTQIQSHLRLKAGEPVNLVSVDRDLRSLYGTGDFYNLRVTEVAVDGGSKLIYFVQEKPTLDDIQFAGDKRFSRQELLQTLMSKTGERLNEWKLFNDSQAIQRWYYKAGHPQATVKCVPKINEQSGRGSIEFQVTEGP